VQLYSLKRESLRQQNKTKLIVMISAVFRRNHRLFVRSRGLMSIKFLLVTNRTREKVHYVYT
jgi:hypothetical protein